MTVVLGGPIRAILCFKEISPPGSFQKREYCYALDKVKG